MKLYHVKFSHTVSVVAHDKKRAEELAYILFDQMLNSDWTERPRVIIWDTKAKRDRDAVLCDRCGGVCHAGDAVVDPTGNLAFCGSYYGNGCDKFMEGDAE